MLGSATANFYNDAFARQGLGEQVAEVQRPWREGRRDEAARLVPRDIGQKTNLPGTPAMIADRIRLYRAAGISTLAVKLEGPLRTRLDILARLIGLVGEINRERPA
jgi:Luciferase-like monooxygenase